MFFLTYNNRTQHFETFQRALKFAMSEVSGPITITDNAGSLILRLWVQV